MTSSTYGSRSRIETMLSAANSAYSSIGLSGNTSIHYGKDVAGTINGESATGKGRVLTGDEDNATTAGLKLEITLTESQLGNGAEGAVTVTRGFASVYQEALDYITRSEEGLIAGKTRSLQNQVDSMDRQIKDIDDRLANRRITLEKKWYDLEMALAELQTEQDYLSSQLENIQSNWKEITG
jgi:flagellar hook-associated protein 2